MPTVATNCEIKKTSGEDPRRGRAFLIGLSILGIVSALPVYHLLAFAFHSDLYSYILLIPLVSGYLFRIQRNGPGLRSGAHYPLLGVPLLIVGVLGLIAYYFVVFTDKASSAQNSSALASVSFVACLAGLVATFAGQAQSRAAAFPLAFLLFMVPFPIAVEHALETFLQHGSALPALWLFKLAGTPVFKEGMVFQLPGISLQIAPECSGIRSTLVLFMTSLVAGQLFLRSPWKRTLLAVFVIPLALVRNGFRVFTIGELCVHVGPHMIDSAIHHKGGSIFFALSLIPFFILVFYLAKSESIQEPSARIPIKSG